MNRYPILQSGFISISETGLKKGVGSNPSFPDNLLLKAYRRVSNQYFYNEEITKLFNRYLANPLALKDFDFRERLIKAAFSAFGTKSIADWIYLQSHQSSVSDLHKSFIVDTLKHIVTLEPRSMEAGQWIRIIEADDKTYNTIIDVRHFFSNSKGEKVPASLTDFINAWLRVPKGFEDMLISLFVIFGERSQRTDVANLD